MAHRTHHRAARRRAQPRGDRYSYALHVVDELVHHGAEAALLRDLYASRTLSQ
ncbi:MAG: hypothetical protein M3O55_12640 [Actinomycetota bacterium]|nr:hypothetical protein [Actinomycetota bacterium]